MNSMLARRALLPASAAAHQVQRRTYVQSSPFYRLVVRSNVTYVTFVLLGSAIGGGLYNKGMDYIWKGMNRGRLYENIDWSKWNSKWKLEE